MFLTHHFNEFAGIGEADTAVLLGFIGEEPVPIILDFSIGVIQYRVQESFKANISLSTSHPSCLGSFVVATLDMVGEILKNPNITTVAWSFKEYLGIAELLAILLAKNRSQKLVLTVLLVDKRQKYLFDEASNR